MDEQETDAPDEVLHEEIIGDNVDPEGVAHACGIAPDGGDYCLGCRKPWPCGDAIRLRVEELSRVEDQVTPEAVIATSVSTGLPWTVVADEMEIPRDDVEQYLATGS